MTGYDLYVWIVGAITIVLALSLGFIGLFYFLYKGLRNVISDVYRLVREDLLESAVKDWDTTVK